jgi:hypothetical protein
MLDETLPLSLDLLGHALQEWSRQSEIQCSKNEM